MKLRLFEDKYKLAETRIENMKIQHEAILKQKNDRIRELEIENELLKRRIDSKASAHYVDKCSTNLKNYDESSSPLHDGQSTSSKRKRKNSDYLVSR